MAMEKAVPQQEEEKKQSDKLEHVVDSMGARSSKEKGHEQSGVAQQSGQGSSPIPPAEHGGHARSQAAHLEQQEHLHGNATKGQRFYEPRTEATTMREPPQDIRRAGKEHRKQ